MKHDYKLYLHFVLLSILFFLVAQVWLPTAVNVVLQLVPIWFYYNLLRKQKVTFLTLLIYFLGSICIAILLATLVSFGQDSMQHSSITIIKVAKFQLLSIVSSYLYNKISVRGFGNQTL